MKENPFLESNELIEKFIKDNNLEVYHLSIYLEQVHGLAVMSDEEHRELLDIEAILSRLSTTLCQ